MKVLERHHDQAIEVLSEHFKDEYITGIEIGTNAGDLTKGLLHKLPNIRKLITVDPWEHYEGAQFEAGNPQEYHDEQKKAALHKLKEFGNRVRIHESESCEVFKEIWARGIVVDFCWIDGHHEKKTVESDLANAIEVVRPGGLIGGHDYGLVDDVTKSVDEVFGDRVQKGGDFTWWVYV